MSNQEPYKISFCTTCMNRLHHVKQTLPKNISDNQDYQNLEFILLNYNSQDDMDIWVERTMKEHMNSGVLTYLKTQDPQYWNPSHAKNIATKYASGDILCNIDADHFTGKGFAQYVNDFFWNNPNSFLSGRLPKAPLDMMGRFCTWKKDFHQINGYDESFNGYGFEDQDIYDRLRYLDREEQHIDINYLQTISHDHSDRVKRTVLMDEIKAILVSDPSPETCVLALKNDNTFEHFVLINIENMVTYDEDRVQTGKWEEGNSSLTLDLTSGETRTLRFSGTPNLYLEEGVKYIWIQSNIDALYYYSLLYNQRVYKKNIKEKNTVVNPQGFGNGKIMKNFEWL